MGERLYLRKLKQSLFDLQHCQTSVNCLSMPKHDTKVKSTCLLGQLNCMLKQLPEIEWDDLLPSEIKKKVWRNTACTEHEFCTYRWCCACTPCMLHKSTDPYQCMAEKLIQKALEKTPSAIYKWHSDLKYCIRENWKHLISFLTIRASS